MPVYAGSDQLYSCLKVLFERIQEEDSQTAQAVVSSHLIIRLSCKLPSAVVTINGRKNPLQILYGPSQVRPDLDVELTANALHQILLAEIPLRKAIASGQMKVRGPVHKIFTLEKILHSGQRLYPDVLRDQGLYGYQQNNAQKP
jgi:hypothetical protein